MALASAFTRLGTTQIITVGAASSAIANAVGAQTYAVRLCSSVGAFVKIDNSPTATTSDVYLPPNWAEYFAITPGQKVAAIQAAAGGSMSVTEMTA